jgi:RNA polymerase sigma factor (sigma-70 family)
MRASTWRPGSDCCSFVTTKSMLSVAWSRAREAGSTVAPDPTRDAPALPADAGPDDFDWDGAIRSYNHRVVVSLMALGLPVDQAEDLAHQAWMRLIEQRRSGQLKDLRLPGLIIVQARFLALNEIKRGQVKRRLAAPFDGLERRLASSSPDPEAHLLSRERVDRACEALARSSRSAQDVFRYAYGDPPLSQAEVAERVGLSIERVRHVLCELRKELRAALESEGEP